MRRDIEILLGVISAAGILSAVCIFTWWFLWVPVGRSLGY